MSTSKAEVRDSLQVIVPQCGYCKKNIVKIGWKCNSCDKVFHAGCGVKMKKCCEMDLISEKNAGDISPLSDIDSRSVSGDSTHQDLLLKIIHELEAKNNILVENNSLLKFKIATLENNIIMKDIEIRNLNKKLSTDKRYVSIDNTRMSKNTIVPSTNTATGDPKCLPSSPNVALAGPSTSVPSERKHNDRNQFTQEQVKSAIIGAQKIQKLTENLNSVEKVDVQVPNQVHKDDTEWKLVNNKKTNRKRRKTLVVGSYSGSSSVEGVDSYKALHVSNLRPDTTAEELQTFLRQNFSVVKCEKLSSRFPDAYSSFKVLIPSSEYKKALDGSNWPNKVNVHHFFHRRKMNLENKN